MFPPFSAFGVDPPDTLSRTILGSLEAVLFIPMSDFMVQVMYHTVKIAVQAYFKNTAYNFLATTYAPIEVPCAKNKKRIIPGSPYSNPKSQGPNSIRLGRYDGDLAQNDCPLRKAL